MQTTFLFNAILAILVLQYVVDTWLDYLNAQRYDDPIPEELQDVLDAEAHQKSMAYKRTNYRFGLIQSTFSLIVTLAFLCLGGFEWIDQWARGLSASPIVQALLFFGAIGIGNGIFALPFSYYHTFVIEERFGFNKSTPALFFADLVKGALLTSVLGGAILALILWFFQWAGSDFWLYAWGSIGIFVLFMNLFYSRLIVPLFNKQVPLGDGSLRNRIEAYAQKVGFELRNIYLIDGSKRSTKANAYFSGFGSQKRITLYDTLTDDLEEEEIVAVLAHEVGHYKRRHIIYNLIVSLGTTGITLFILSLFINHPEMAKAIGVSQPSFHAALIGFGLLYGPISDLTGLAMHYLSRTFEYQADAYARDTFGADPLVTALKKLSRNNLSNLTPHPAYVFVHYSHPPLIARIRHLKA